MGGLDIRQVGEVSGDPCVGNRARSGRGLVGEGNRLQGGLAGDSGEDLLGQEQADALEDREHGQGDAVFALTVGGEQRRG